MPCNHKTKVSLSLALAVLAAVTLTSCSRTKEKILLQREWVANAEFVGDVWAEDLSHTAGPVIEVREGSEAADPIRAVRSQRAQIGVASSDRILRENEGGADLLVLATATYKSPVVFLGHPEDKISSPKDFRGRVVGIQTGTNTELVFKSLIKSQGILPGEVRVVDSGWGTQNFESGRISVLAAFDYDETVQLSRKSVSYSELYPEQFGVRYVGTVYFTSREFARQHPDLVQAFMDKLVQGWVNAISKPDEAISRLKRRFPSLDAAKERQSLTRGIPYFRGEDGMMLHASPERWSAMAKNLIDLKLLKTFSFDHNVDYQFLEKALVKVHAA